MLQRRGTQSDSRRNEEEAVSDTDSAPALLDITADVCPLTFVRTRLALERLAPGARLLVRLNAGEPLRNVPRALAELGHGVEAPEPEDPARPDGPHRLRVTRS
jgi:tRNA 2-thiouridine synthesizing protein A